MTSWRLLLSLWACVGAAVHVAGGVLGRIRSPLRSSSDGDDRGVGSGKIRMRFVLVLLFALGLDPRCSPMGFVFRPSIVWPPGADSCAPSALHASMADALSTKSIRAGRSGRWLLQQIHDWKSHMKMGGGSYSALAGSAGGRSRRRRDASGKSGGCVVISVLFRVCSAKNRGCNVSLF